MKSKGLLFTLWLSVGVFFAAIFGQAWAQGEPFYKGKTITIMVGSTAGGFYDRWARLFAQYMGKYIPGNPDLIAQKMAGGRSWWWLRCGLIFLTASKQPQ